MANRIIIVGCSHSHKSGFIEKNIHKHYSALLKNKTGRDIVNLSIGGMSNHEIFLRALEYATIGDIAEHDVLLVQWTSLHRLWVYQQDNNVDDFTQVLPHPVGTNPDLAWPLYKTYSAHYCNDYMALKFWFEYMISLQAICRLKNIKYVFVTGFDNLLGELDVYRNQTITSLADINLHKDLRKILDFDNRPDWYILKKLNVLLDLYNQLDFSNCLRFGDFYFGKFKLDFADDGLHFGEQCHIMWAEEILNHLSKMPVSL